MVTSMVMVPHVAHIDEADVTDLDVFRRRERERRAGQPGGRMSLLPFVNEGDAAGLAEARMFNASLDPLREEIVYKKFYHVGVAVDSGRGLVNARDPRRGQEVDPHDRRRDRRTSPHVRARARSTRPSCGAGRSRSRTSARSAAPR